MKRKAEIRVIEQKPSRTSDCQHTTGARAEAWNRFSLYNPQKEPTFQHLRLRLLASGTVDNKNLLLRLKNKNKLKRAIQR